MLGLLHSSVYFSQQKDVGDSFLIDNSACYHQTRKFARACCAFEGVLVGCLRKIKVLANSECTAYLVALGISILKGNIHLCECERSNLFGQFQ